MHTSTTMKTEQFGFAADGVRVTFDEVFPDFRIQDRVGILTHTPNGSLAAAPMLLAAIGLFYELHIATARTFTLIWTVSSSTPDGSRPCTGGSTSGHPTRRWWWPPTRVDPRVRQ